MKKAGRPIGSVCTVAWETEMVLLVMGLQPSFLEKNDVRAIVVNKNFNFGAS